IFVCICSDLLAVRRLAILSRSFFRHRCWCLLRFWARNFSQGKWHSALERTVRLGPLFAESVFVSGPLSSPMSTLGGSHSQYLDWPKTEQSRSRESGA